MKPVRAILRHKKTYLTAAGILSLGIGMSVAMFTLVDAVLLRPLPFARQQSIEVIWKVDPQAGKYVEEMAYPELGDLQQNVHDLEYVAVMPTSLYGYAKALQIENHEPVQIESAPVSHDFFRVLGVSPVLGRDFQASDERVGAAPVVIVSDRVWREHLSADPRIVGRMIRLNREGYTVIGVMAAGVEFPRGAGFWVPLGVDQNVVEHRGATFLQAIGLARPGVPHERIAAEVDTLVRRLAVEHPEAYPPSQRAVVTPLINYWTGSSRIQLWILLGASVLLLATSILSAGILILSGILARRTEIATRAALGAQSRQILAQLAAEGALIAGSAAIAGTILASFVTAILVRYAPSDIPRLADASLSWAGIGFSVVCASLAAIICTLIPGWAAIRLPLESVLREGGVRLSLSRRSLRTRNIFILAQTALTVAMLAIAGLFVLSYRSMISTDTGFANRDTLSLNLQLRGPGLFSGSAIAPPTRQSFYFHLLSRLRETPGVLSAGAVLVRPLEGTIGWDRGYELDFEAGRNKSSVLPKGNYEAITPDYFRTVGTPLLEGRDFTEHDSEESDPVVIISRNLAQRFRAAGKQPLGRRIRLGGSPEWLKVVGVCADARYRGVTQEDVGLFVPYRQSRASTNYLVIRGKQSASELGSLVRQTLARMDPAQAAAGDATIGKLVDANTAREKFNMILLLWFGGCAVLLAMLGIYAVIAGAVAARKREIAIRAALGAPRGRLVGSIVYRTLGFALAGELIGTAAAILAYGRLSGLFYGVAPYRLYLFGSVVLFVLAASLCAGCWPAWSAGESRSMDLS
ncbi:MAG TPA: ADOP family duplicated permease [Bryobacteraceae bacterium]|nr:ADOP family duplicated permease [Bryobacteraceae bacterium]